MAENIETATVYDIVTVICGGCKLDCGHGRFLYEHVAHNEGSCLKKMGFSDLMSFKSERDGEIRRRRMKKQVIHWTG